MSISSSESTKSLSQSTSVLGATAYEAKAEASKSRDCGQTKDQEIMS